MLPRETILPLAEAWARSCTSCNGNAILYFGALTRPAQGFRALQNLLMNPFISIFHFQWISNQNINAWKNNQHTKKYHYLSLLQIILHYFHLSAAFLQHVMDVIRGKRHQCFLAGWLNKALTFSRSVTSVFSWTTGWGCSRADFSNARTKACAFFLSVMSKFAKMLDVAMVSSSFMVLTWIKYIRVFHDVKSNSKNCAHDSNKKSRWWNHQRDLFWGREGHTGGSHSSATAASQMPHVKWQKKS